MNLWLIIYRVTWTVLGVVCAVAVVCAFRHKCLSVSELQRRQAALHEDNRAKERAIEDLRSKQERFRTDRTFVERVARDMGMARTNEIVFKHATGRSGTRTTRVPSSADATAADAPPTTDNRQSTTDNLISAR